MFPGNKGYFRRGIAMSGSVTCPWSLNRNLAKDTVRLGQLLGCDIDSGSENIIHCISSRPADEVMDILNERENKFLKFPMSFIPTIDGEFVKEDPMKVLNGLTDPSSESLTFFASIDLMTGIVSNEGGMMASPCVDINDPENFAPTAEEFERVIVPRITKLLYGDVASDVISDVITDMIITEYKNWTDPEDVQTIRESFLAMSAHYVFDTHVRLTADFHAKVASKKNTFVYTVDAFPSQHLLLTPSWMSKPNHADDLNFLFGYDPEGFIAWTEPYSEQFIPDQEELEISKFLMTAFTNFAKSGNPNKPFSLEKTVSWPRYDSITGQYLEITKHMSDDSVKKHFCAKANNFWNNLIPNVIKRTKALNAKSPYLHVDTKDSCASPASCEP